MKREALDPAWSRNGFAGAVPSAGVEPPPAGVADSTLAARLRATWDAVLRRIGRRRAPDPLAGMPRYLLADIGLGDPMHADPRVHFESQVERFARTSGQLGGASERFGPW